MDDKLINKWTSGQLYDLKKKCILQNIYKYTQIVFL